MRRSAGVASAPEASTCTYIVSDPRSRAVRLSGVSTATTRPLLMITTRWQVAGAPLGLDRLVEDVESGDNGLAFRRRHVAGENPHRRRLAGAVGAEEAENLAPFDAKADVVDGSDAAIAFREVLNLNHRGSP